ncbi:MAG TPA: PTS sugar transporter subunit IIA [Gemmatimonadales bacterium]|nr:PTS sugar transporter subunit IIA [Gemmatimonadales bacterium]
MLLTELLTPERVVVPLAARDKAGIIAELTHHLVDHAGGAYQEVLGAVEEREAVLSTGIGFGVAIPHARSSAVRELSVVCGVSPVPVPYDSIDSEPVRLFFLIVGPEASAGQHIKVLSRIARLVRRDSLRERLCHAKNAEQFYAALLDAEATS